MSGKVNIRQGALQPQMGTEPNTVIVSYQNSINLRFCQCRFCTCVERNPRNQLDTRNQAIHLHDIHCKPYGERNICTRKPSDATCVRGKACNMILAMHSTCLQKTSSYVQIQELCCDTKFQDMYSPKRPSVFFDGNF